MMELAVKANPSPKTGSVSLPTPAYFSYFTETDLNCDQSSTKLALEGVARRAKPQPPKASHFRTPTGER